VWVIARQPVTGVVHHFATVRSASKPWIQPFNFVKPRT
jgi:hypothetical protein